MRRKPCYYAKQRRVGDWWMLGAQFCMGGYCFPLSFEMLLISQEEKSSYNLIKNTPITSWPASCHVLLASRLAFNCTFGALLGALLEVLASSLFESISLSMIQLCFHFLQWTSLWRRIKNWTRLCWINGFWASSIALGIEEHFELWMRSWDQDYHGKSLGLYDSSLDQNLEIMEAPRWNTVVIGTFSIGYVGAHVFRLALFDLHGSHSPYNGVLVLMSFLNDGLITYLGLLWHSPRDLGHIVSSLIVV